MLTTKIKSPSGTIWEGQAEVISSENTVGKFDILPGHANFVTLISKKPIILQHKRVKKEFLFDRAVIYVANDTVSIYTELLHRR